MSTRGRRKPKLYGPGELVPMAIPAEVVGRLYAIGAGYGLTVVETIEALASGRALPPKHARIEMLAGGRTLQSKPSNPTKKAKKRNV